MTTTTRGSDIVAFCGDCKRGYVWVNWKNPNPRCLACGGPIKPINADRKIAPRLSQRNE